VVGSGLSMRAPPGRLHPPVDLPGQVASGLARQKVDNPDSPSWPSPLQAQLNLEYRRSSSPSQLPPRHPALDESCSSEAPDAAGIGNSSWDGGGGGGRRGRLTVTRISGGRGLGLRRFGRVVECCSPQAAGPGGGDGGGGGEARETLAGGAAGGGGAESCEEWARVRDQLPRLGGMCLN
jgi:hypothetical protein